MEITSLSIVISIHRAQDLQIFKDSEAAQPIRKSVEVRGLVVAVYTSKKGNTFINFGGKRGTGRGPGFA
jgi:hypothetical protein